MRALPRDRVSEWTEKYCANALQYMNPPYWD